MERTAFAEQILGDSQTPPCPSCLTLVDSLFLAVTSFIYVCRPCAYIVVLKPRLANRLDTLAARFLVADIFKKDIEVFHENIYKRLLICLHLKIFLRRIMILIIEKKKQKPNPSPNPSYQCSQSRGLWFAVCRFHVLVV